MKRKSGLQKFAFMLVVGCFMLSLTSLLGTTTVKAASEKKIYQKYLDKQAEKVQEISEYKLVDLNGDGTKELLMNFYDGGVRSSGRICTIVNGKVKKLLDAGGTPVFYKKSDTQNVIAVYGTESANQYAYVLYELSADKAKKTDVYMLTYQDEKTITYEKNWKKISAKEFKSFKKSLKKCKNFKKYLHKIEIGIDPVGGWELKDIPAVELKGEAGTALAEAAKMHMGSSIEPIALLGTQVVAGTNYCIFCKVTPVTPNAKFSYALVYVNAPISGTARIMNIVEIVPSASDYGTVTLPEQELTGGGWTINDETFSAPKGSYEEPFKKASESYMGASLQPVAYLASQVVAGYNHCVLCKATLATQDKNEKFVLAYIYEDLQGGASFTSVDDIDIAGLASKE